LDDPLVTRGPYGIVRHPQFLSAIGVTFFTVMVHVSSYRLARGGGPWVPFWDRSGIGFANWVLFTVTLWVLAVLEDRELAAHFGVEYEEYIRCVPRLFPN
jgi:protein-S-isoprenylcysteine O-methyltransferase Ste14